MRLFQPNSNDIYCTLAALTFLAMVPSGNTETSENVFDPDALKGVFIVAFSLLGVAGLACLALVISGIIICAKDRCGNNTLDEPALLAEEKTVLSV